MNECVLIARAAARFGIPASAPVALRIAENGGPGREFGVLSVPATTYEDQVEVAARSLRNAERRYGQPARAGGRYTAEFLRFFSARWAPVGAGNDPTNLNANHAENLIAAYALFA